MAYQSEAALEQQFIEQLNKQGYTSVSIPNYDALVENFKIQFAAFNAAKLDHPLTSKEWERVFNIMLGKSVFQSAKILRDKFVLEREDGTKVYLSFFDADHTKNIFQVTNQTTVVGKYVNRYDVTILVNGLPLIQVELKRRGIDIREAVNQVMRYKKHSYNGLYHFIQLFVVSNGVDTKYFANSDRDMLHSLAFFWTDFNNVRITNLKEFSISFLARDHIILKRIKKIINQAVKNCSRRPVVDDVVLVGGSAQLKVLQNYLSDLFGRQVHVSPNPEKAIALWIGVYAGIKLRDKEMQDIVMTDVCPFSLGVGARHSTQDQTVYMETMIPRSSMLPCAKEKMFYTLYDGQTALNFKIYQGEQYYVENNLELGEITVSVIPDKAGNQWAKVTFIYDINGILYVSVQSCTGEIKEKEIVNEKLHLSQEELEKSKEKLTNMIQSQLNLDENELIQRFVYLYQFASPMEKQRLDLLFLI